MRAAWVLAWALLAAGAAAAPVPPPRVKPVPPPLAAWEVEGAWELRPAPGAAPRWYITLSPGGAYRAHSDRDAHDRGESNYAGEWRLRAGLLEIAERGTGAAPDAAYFRYGGAARRVGHKLTIGGTTWMAGEWQRR